jgi:dTMP kinase
VAGAFITLEGIDGCGKTTQARLLAEALRRRGRSVRLTREPGGTEAGAALRDIVLARDRGMPAQAELFIYLADRAIHVAQVVLPALEGGEIVICERYSDSTLAYQGYGRGLDLGLLRRLNDMATGGCTPDLTIVLDIAPPKARLDASRLDRLESEGPVFAERVARGFRELAASEPARVKLVDGTGDIRAVHADVMRLVDDLLAGLPADTQSREGA